MDLTKAEFLGSLSNEMYSCGHLVLGAVVAGSVDIALNLIAKKIFNTQNGNIFLGIHAISFAVGIGTSICLAPQTAFVSIAASSALKLMMMSSLICGGLYCLTRRLLHTPFITGSVIGVVGPLSYIPFGALGAYGGVFIGEGISSLITQK